VRELLHRHQAQEERRLARCSQCDRLLKVALDVSKAYHALLGSIEAADIRHDTDLAYDLQAQKAESVLNRDGAIMALRNHERMHAKGAHGVYLLKVAH